MESDENEWWRDSREGGGRGEGGRGRERHTDRQIGIETHRHTDKHRNVP